MDRQRRDHESKRPTPPASERRPGSPDAGAGLLDLQRQAGNAAVCRLLGVTVQRGLWGMDKGPNMPQPPPDLADKVKKLSDPAFASFQLRATWVKAGRESAEQLPKAFAAEVAAAGPDAQQQVLRAFGAEFVKIVEEEKAVIGEFDKSSRGILESMLAASAKKLDEEMRRYGFKESDTGELTVAATPDVAKLAAAAKELVAADAVVANLQIELGRKYAASHPGGPMEDAQNREATARDVLGDPRYIEAVQNYERMFAGHLAQFPILAAYRNKPADLNALAQAQRSPAAAAIAGKPLLDKRKDIKTTQKNITDGTLSVYGLPNIVAAAKEQQGAPAGSLKARFVDDRVAKVQHDKAMVDMALGAIAAAAMVVATIATAGGAPILAGAAAGAGIGIGAAQTMEQIQQFGVAAAAGNTDLDRARAISQTDPSLFWLAVHIAMFVADVVTAAGLLRQVAAPVRKLVTLRQSVGSEAPAEATAQVVKVFEEEVKPAANALPPAARDRVLAAVDPRTAMSETVVSLVYDDYLQALSHVFPQRYLDDVTRIVDRIGERAAANVARDPAFVALCRQRRWNLAGTRFHNEAKVVGRQMVTAGEAPANWLFEYTVQSGRGGSRLDVLARGPARELIEIDWKTTGRSALSTKSRDEMVKHAGHVGMNLQQQLSGQTSVSWVDLVRSHLAAENIVWP